MHCRVQSDFIMPVTKEIIWYDNTKYYSSVINVTTTYCRGPWFEYQPGDWLC
jgi:hypothetical protein